MGVGWPDGRPVAGYVAVADGHRQPGMRWKPDMRWEEESNPGTAAYDADVIDFAFRLSGRWLPVDHARALRAAIVEILPWLEDEPEAGIHSIHGAASGNGWERPGGGSGGMLNLSRRTRLVLRVPVRRAGETAALCGRRLDVGGCELTTGERRPRRLKPAGAVFARYVVDEEDGDEERFMEHVASELRARSVTARKLLCGRSHRIESAHGAHVTRSLLIADPGRDESLALQCRGIGPGRLLGCGLFVPHKDVGPVRRMVDDA